MTSRELLALLVVAVPALAAALVAAAPRRHVHVVATIGALASSAAAAALSIVALSSPGSPLVERWVVVDAAAGLLVGVIGIVGLTAVLVSPAYLATATTGLVRPERRPRTFYALIFGFWAILAAVPLVGNLGGAWLLVEATHRCVRAPRRLRREAARARGGVEVPDPHLARPRRRAARHRRARRRVRARRTRRAVVARARTRPLRSTR